MPSRKGEAKGTRIKLGTARAQARAEARHTKRRKKRLEALRDQRKSM